MENKSPIANMFLFLAEKSDGKKTISGVILFVGGLLTFLFTPDYKQEGIAMMASGLPILITGVTHKIVKSQGEQNEVS